MPAPLWAPAALARAGGPRGRTQALSAGRRSGDHERPRVQSHDPHPPSFESF